MRREHIISYIYLLATMTFWAGTFISGKVIATSVDPTIGAFIRFVFATLALSFPILLMKQKVPVLASKEWFQIFILAITGPVGFNLFFFTGLQFIEAGRAALIVSLNPLAITLAAALIFGERLTLYQLIGIVIALTGSVIVISKGDYHTMLSSGIGFGELAIVGCIICWTIYSLVGKVVMERLSPIHTVLYSSFIGAIILFILSLKLNLMDNLVSLSISGWANLFFIGTLGTAAGVTLYYAAIKEIGTMRAGVYINLVPFIAVLMSWLFLDEAISIPVIIGGGILVIGVIISGIKIEDKKEVGLAVNSK